jgi:hypothetical protein
MAQETAPVKISRREFLWLLAAMTGCVVAGGGLLGSEMLTHQDSYVIKDIHRAG